jgi:hypothetical protein
MKRSAVSQNMQLILLALRSQGQQEAGNVTHKRDMGNAHCILVKINLKKRGHFAGVDVNERKMYLI